MAYKSIDELQTLLSANVFGDRLDSKKAAGRALGTFIETIVYYLLRQWGEVDSVAIERPLAEYGREDITHNVEFTLHPELNNSGIIKVPSDVSLTAKRMAQHLSLPEGYRLLNNKLIDKNVLQNGCLIGDDNTSFVLVGLDSIENDNVNYHASILAKHAYAMIECKRVGKEGDAKGPQTIEKAKQGAYVAKTTSLLQKVRNDQGGLDGIYYIDGQAYVGSYDSLLKQIVLCNDARLLKHFTMSIGVVSNHGNWFTAENQNKEMRVLAQSYDWLLFLTDEGLSQFITDLLINPRDEYSPIRDAFMASYQTDASNMFTKKRMELNAHFALDSYFSTHINEIESWFNVIAPDNGSLNNLKEVLFILKTKDWRNLL